MTRDDVVRLGRAGRAWDFVPVVFQALAQAPEDAGLRVLAAANLATLGLVTAAREQMELLPAPVARDASLGALWALVGEEGRDRVDQGELRRTCRRNVVRLRERGVDLSAPLEQWEAELSGWEWFRARDGNVARRRGGAWVGLADGRGFAERLAAAHFAPVDAQAGLLVLEGADPPWMLLKLIEAAARQADGFQARIALVQEDPQELLCGLALADVEALGEERVTVFAGPGAGGLLGEWLASRAEFKCAGPVVGLATVRMRTEPPLARVIQEAEAAQIAEHVKLEGEVKAVYARGDAGWRRPDSGAALRVLVPTTRYSTFVKHSSADLVGALERAGCEARLMIEPDDHTRFSTIAYLRTLREWRPDLVILINHMRAGLGDWMPRELPLVCWIQDAMPHHFDAALGAKQTEYDYIVGHLHEEMFERFGFPRARTLSAPVVASGAKFHTGGCAPALLEKYACEVALVTHQGETPRRMHERLVGEAGRGSASARLLEALYPRIGALVERLGPMPTPLHAPVRAMVDEEIDRHLGLAGDRARALVLRTYALPMADRMLRHQTAAWAAELCRERGWRFGLYGRGWGEAAELAEFARGEVPHDEELRACYRAASVHLHVSAHALCHQRVMECALSGGLPVCRLLYETLQPLCVRAQWSLVSGSEPAAGEPGRPGYVWMDHEAGAAYAALLQRLGIGADAYCWLTDARRGAWRGNRQWRPPEPDAAVSLLVDVGETAFTSRERLAELVAGAIERPAWREGWSRAIAAQVRGRYTHDRFVRDVLGLVGLEARRAGGESGR